MKTLKELDATDRFLLVASGSSLSFGVYWATKSIRWAGILYIALGVYLLFMVFTAKYKVRGKEG